MSDLETRIREILADPDTPDDVLFRAVWECNTPCGPNHKWRKDRIVYYPHQADVYVCEACLLNHYDYSRKGPPEPQWFKPPDYKDPRNWWPLAWEKRIVIINSSNFRELAKGLMHSIGMYTGFYVIMCDDKEKIGREVCRAVLKMWLEEEGK